MEEPLIYLSLNVQSQKGAAWIAPAAPFFFLMFRKVSLVHAPARLLLCFP
jgi:hypothetical protein